MGDEREIRKETGFWGGEKEVIYENGQKVGEIKSEERGGFFGIGGDTVKVEYNTNGDEIGYTKQEERGGFFGIGADDVQVRYNTHGEEVSHSRIEEKGGFLGIGTHHIRVEYDNDGNEVSQSNWEKRGGFLGIGAKRVRVTRYTDDKPPSVVVDSSRRGGSSESDDSSAAVVIILIIIGALWWYGSGQKVEQEKADIGLRTEKQLVAVIPQPEQSQMLSEVEKRQIIADKVYHNQQSKLVDGILSQGTITLSGSLTSIDAETVGSGGFWWFSFAAMGDKTHYSFGCNDYNELYFRIGGNDVNWTTGTKAMRSQPNHVTLYFRSQDWDFVQRCSRGSRCDGSACPLAIVIEPSENSGRDTRIVSSIAKRKEWKPKTSVFAPPSRDDL